MPLRRWLAKRGIAQASAAVFVQRASVSVAAPPSGLAGGEGREADCCSVRPCAQCCCCLLLFCVPIAYRSPPSTLLTNNDATDGDHATRSRSGPLVHPPARQPAVEYWKWLLVSAAAAGDARLPASAYTQTNDRRPAARTIRNGRPPIDAALPQAVYVVANAAAACC